MVNSLGSKKIKLLAIATSVVIVAVVVWAFDPAESLWMPKCLVHAVTGLQCPGCGITRAAHAFLHGNFAEAWAYNRFLIISLPYLLAVGLVSYIPAFYRRDSIRRIVLGMPLAITYIILFLLWFIIRNLLGI